MWAWSMSLSNGCFVIYPLHWSLQFESAVTDREVIRKSIESFLSKTGAPNIFKPIDKNFYDICCQRALDKQYPMSTDRAVPSLYPCMDTGVQFAYHAFGHLENEEKLIFIALYTAFLVYVDSAFVRDDRNLRVFNERFIRNER